MLYIKALFSEMIRDISKKIYKMLHKKVNECKPMADGVRIMLRKHVKTILFKSRGEGEFLKLVS